MFYLGVTGLVVLVLLHYCIPKTEHWTSTGTPSIVGVPSCEIGAELDLLRQYLQNSSS